MRSVKFWIFNLTAGMLLILLGIAALLVGNIVKPSLPLAKAQQETPQFVELPIELTAQSNLSEISLFMLHSHETWENIQIDGALRFGDRQVFNRLIVMQESSKGPFKAYVEYGFAEEDKPYHFLLDNTTITEWQTNLNVYTQRNLEESFTFPPLTLPAINDAENPIIPHPLEGILPTSFSDLLFPAGLAQSLALGMGNGEVSISGIDIVAERSTLIVLWIPGPSTKQLFWVDTQTGIILKRENFSIDDNGEAHLDEQIEITMIRFDAKTFFSIGSGFSGFQYLEPGIFDEQIYQEWMRELGDEQ